MEALVVYSNNTCPNCVNLKRALKIKGVEFKEINLHETPEAVADIHAQGMRQLPVINDNGNWMMGFTPTNFNKILQARVAVPA
jgi:glutaredoxin-like protein NrdH